ncbi:MAG: cytochrome c biogenesis protein CcdA, partial [Thermoflexales bacterium]
LGGQLARMSRALASINNELEFLLLGDATLNVPVAAVAGLLSFLSPCVLPLIPAYIGFISGSALQQAAAGGTTR